MAEQKKIRLFDFEEEKIYLNGKNEYKLSENSL